MPERQIYLLDPKNLSAETIAVTFAKTSRSPQSFRQIAAELTDEKSADFNEKWVVGYGHASVAEHAVLHIAVENVSRVAVEVIESNRLASYTEKSTRYQKWDADAFFTPPELASHPALLGRYQTFLQQIYQTYQQSLQAVRAVVQAECPQQAAESTAAYERRIHPQVVDACRFLLPASALVNLGITINARALEHALCKMLSHPLEEVQAIGREIKLAAQQQLPTLVKYANPLPYLQNTQRWLTADAASLPASPREDWCRLVSFDAQGEDRIMAAALYRFGQQSYADCLTAVQAASSTERAQLVSHIIGALGAHDIPLRELEYATFTFEVTLDQGAYFELKRHRMMTQTPQPLGPTLGYAVPRLISAAGIGPIFHAAMQQADQLYQEMIRQHPAAGAYVIPNAYNRRVLLNLNLRSAAHFISLRSALNAHFSIRRVARRMAEQISAVSPLFAAVLNAEPSETWQQIENDHFTT